MSNTTTSSTCAPGEQRISPTRTRATWKPRVDDVDVPLYRCPLCGSIRIGLGKAGADIETDIWRSVIMRPPYADAPCPSCLPASLQPLKFNEACAADEGYDYAFTGGMDANRLTLSWNESASAPHLAVLKTFTGLHVRVAPPDTASDSARTMTFPLADDDAYCYCDLDPCEWCTARCKRGFRLYVLCRNGRTLRFSCENPPSKKLPD